ncbi:MAG: OsmC family protein [Planctomycetota bacterium]
MSLDESLSDYKEKVVATNRATLTWDRDLVFTATTQRGYDIEFDAEMEWGCMPLEGVLLSLAGCMAIDVVSILTKMRTPPESFSMEIEGERNVTPPQRYLGIHMTLHLAGADLAEEKVQRAVDLSQGKYCSVYNTLRPDLEVTTSFVINEEVNPEA